MNIQELLSLNQTIFGTKLPKIRAMQGSVGITYDLIKTNAENIFFYFGENTNVDVYVGGDNTVHVKDYCNLSDVLSSINYSSTSVHIEFKLVYPQKYEPVLTETLPLSTDKSGKITYDPQNFDPTPVLWNVTDNVDYYSILGSIESTLRVYLLEYDQTKIMKL